MGRISCESQGNKRRGGGGGRDGGREKKARDDRKSNKPGGDQWVNERRNEDFEAYYKQQGIVPEGEWEEFIKVLGTDLPVTFRINGSGRFADHLRDKLQKDFFSHFSNGDIMVRVAWRMHVNATWL